jgi:hypothetical protein
MVVVERDAREGSGPIINVPAAQKLNDQIVE